MNSQLNAQIEAIGDDIKVLGSFVWWNFKGTLISWHDLVWYFKEHGLPHEWLISEPSPETSFARACSKFDKTKVGNTTFLIRPILKDNNRIMVGVIAEDEVNENLQHSQSFKIVLNRGDNSVVSENPGHEISQGVTARFKELLGHLDTYDISRQILQVIGNLQGLHVREKGGVYFVLDSGKETLTKLQEMVAYFGAGSMYILPQIDVAQTRAAISAAFTGNITSDIETFNKNIESWNSKNPHQKSLDNAVEEIDIMKKKVETYSRVLKLDAAAFNEPISSIQQGLNKLYQRKIKIT
jgi:hypothetical protein